MEKESVSVKTFNEHKEDFHSEGGGEEHALSAALARLVMDAIVNGTYVVYSESVRDSIKEEDVICTFNIGGDPFFGVLRDDDGEPVIVFSTDKGLMQKYL